MENIFPKNFLWGASSSSFQIEGGWDKDNKSMTVADFNSFKKSASQADSKVVSDFYSRWKEDIGLMKELGIKIYRFSISWARIIPEGDGEINQKGIDFYNNGEYPRYYKKYLEEYNIFYEEVINTCKSELECVKKIEVYAYKKFSLKISNKEKLYLIMHIHRILEVEKSKTELI